MNRDLQNNLNLALICNMISLVNPLAWLGAAFVFLLSFTSLKRATALEARTRPMTPSELTVCNRIAEIEAMPGFGLTGLSLPWPVFSEYKRLLRQRDAIVL